VAGSVRDPRRSQDFRVFVDSRIALLRGSVRFCSRARAGSAPVLIFVASQFHSSRAWSVRRLRFSRWIFPSRLFFCLRFPLPAFWSRSQRRSIFPLSLSFLVPAPEVFFRLVLLALAACVQTAPPDFRLGVNPIPELLFTPAWSSRGFVFFVFRVAVLHARFPLRSRSEHAPSSRAQAQGATSDFPTWRR
jgi:hypothetical protein